MVENEQSVSIPMTLAEIVSDDATSIMSNKGRPALKPRENSWNPELVQLPIKVL